MSCYVLIVKVQTRQTNAQESSLFIRPEYSFGHLITKEFLLLILLISSFFLIPLNKLLHLVFHQYHPHLATTKQGKFLLIFYLFICPFRVSLSPGTLLLFARWFIFRIRTFAIKGLTERWWASLKVHWPRLPIHCRALFFKPLSRLFNFLRDIICCLV